MAKVRDGTAPADAPCQESVTNAAKAIATVDDMRALIDQGDTAQGDNGPFVFSVDCTDEWVVETTNNSAVPYRFFGFFSWGAGDEVSTLGIRPIVTQEMPPGSTMTDTAPFGSVQGSAQSDGCYWRGLPMLTGEPARGFDYPGTAAADDPQASDDPAVWFPAWQDQLNIARQNGSIEYLIDHAFDPQASRLDGAIELKAPSELRYCETVDVPLPDDLEGDWAVLLMSGRTGFVERSEVVVALFARGSDRVWRAMSTPMGVPWTYNPDDPCSTPPLDL